jgi:predicted lipid-binding transport protein (Tim44 family)
VRHRPEAPPSDHDPSQWFMVGSPASPGIFADGGVDVGVDTINAVDRSCDPDKFLTWTGSVYDRAIAAWREKNAELLRPVMAQEVWNHYAQFLLTVSSVALGRKLMASAEATATLVAAGADERTQSVLISFAVTMAASQASLIDQRARRWLAAGR